MLKIVTAPNLILSQSAKPVTVRYLAKQISKIDKDVLKLIGEMGKTLLAAKDPEGVGLAAPQIDKSLQIFMTKQTPKSPIQVFINPRIISNIKHKLLNRDENILDAKQKKRDTKLEGCLSLPNIWGEVIRDPQITISYLDEKGNTHTRTFKGLFATIIQHEIDHLNGILFPKRVLEQKGILYKSHKDEKKEDIFEEIEL